MDLLTLIRARLAAIPPNRAVAFLTPLVFVPAAGWLAAWAAVHLPGIPSLDAAHLTAVFVAGALAALTAAHKWLSGWQAHEADVRHAKLARAGPGADPDAVLSGPADVHPDDAVPDVDDLDGEKRKAAEADRTHERERKRRG